MTRPKMAREIIDAGNAVPVRQRTNVFIKKEKESTMKKKILATVLTAAMAVSMLAGCSSESASKGSSSNDRRGNDSRRGDKG